MECKEAMQLLSTYNRAALALSVSVQHLLNGGRVVPQSIYYERRRAADKARNEFESSRLAYEGHIQEHHCERRGTQMEAHVR